MRRRAIPSPEANTNLTNDPWMTFGGGTFGNSVLLLSTANGAEGPTINRWRVNDLDTKHDLILSRRSRE